MFRGLSLTITQALSDGTRFLHLLQAHSPCLVICTLVLDQADAVDEVLMLKAKRVNWELSECKSLLL